jgi:hypothetical protein
LTSIDEAITRLAPPPARSPAGTTLLHALIGMRRCLFPQARFFVTVALPNQRLRS